MRRLPHKLRNYELARALGVAVPHVFGTWPRADTVDLAGVPEVFVLKSVVGAASRGVFPLRREEGMYHLISGDQRWTEAELRVELRAREAQGVASGGWFAEEFVGDPGRGCPRT